MTFVNTWQAQLDNVYADFAHLATQYPEIDFICVLAAAILWPVAQPIKQYNLETIQAVQQVAGDNSSAILNVIQNWPADRLEAARYLAQQGQNNPELRTALTQLIDYFQATPAFTQHLARQVSDKQVTGNINISDISGGEVTVGAIISGIVHGDVVSGDRVGGDKVGRDKIVHITNIFNYAAEKPRPQAPVLPYEPETILIPAGPFLMGYDNGQPEEAPQHQVNLPDYHIGKYPVTNQQYAVFIQHNRHYEPPTNPRWSLREPPKGKTGHPVTGVSWNDALAYCAWLSEQTQQTRVYRLPSEAEWEKAARGGDGRLYPWGNTWSDGLCNAAGTDTTPITTETGEPTYPNGAGPYGCCDMLGNVQEWTNTLWGSDLTENSYPYEYNAQDGREDINAGQRLPRTYRVYRGGFFKDTSDTLRCSARAAANAASPSRWRGFRVVVELR
jgi:formylglycine-generating enzyme required for sulfatase activity